jgi:hypothetical protein
MEPTTGIGFNGRVRLAHRHREAELNRDLGQAEIGIEMGKFMETDPLTQATVSRYFRDTEPELQKICALAHVLGVDCGWLAFGEKSEAPHPPWFTPPTSDGGVDGPGPNEERAKNHLGLARGARKPPKPPHRRSG